MYSLSLIMLVNALVGVFFTLEFQFYYKIQGWKIHSFYNVGVSVMTHLIFLLASAALTAAAVLGNWYLISHKLVSFP